SNVNTYGFKTSRVTFRDIFYQNMSAGSSAQEGGMGGTNPNQIGYGSAVASIDRDTTRAGFADTGYAMDCYINGEGYFATYANDNEDEGMEGIMYSRVGMFGFDAAGNMVDSTGRYVVGIRAEDGLEGVSGEDTEDALFKIFYDPTSEGDNEGIVPLSNISIGANGIVTALGNDGNTYGFGEGGELINLTDAPEDEVDCLAVALVNVDNPAGLTLAGDSYYTAAANSGIITYSLAGSNNTGSIKTGGLEMSGVDIAKEFSDMILTQRGFQANSRIITTVDSMLEEVVNLKR
ncbi:MAG: hypothetical protein IKM15_04405, partial [Peptococcaceae bacterium]|nr:hypothetical protein [Peptococcaceae bacterium]